MTDCVTRLQEQPPIGLPLLLILLLLLLQLLLLPLPLLLLLLLLLMLLPIGVAPISSCSVTCPNKHHAASLPQVPHSHFVPSHHPHCHIHSPSPPPKGWTSTQGTWQDVRSHVRLATCYIHAYVVQIVHTHIRITRKSSVIWRRGDSECYTQWFSCLGYRDRWCD